VAQKEHGHCLDCGELIMAGDPYIGEVWVYPDGLIIKKRHEGCPVNPDDDKKHRRQNESHEKTGGSFFYFCVIGD